MGNIILPQVLRRADAAALPMRCGNCESYSFSPRVVAPRNGGAPRVVTIGCQRCGALYSVDDQARVGARSKPVRAAKPGRRPNGGAARA